MEKGKGISGGRRIGCNRGDSSARRGPRSVGGDVLREEPVGSH